MASLIGLSDVTGWLDTASEKITITAIDEALSSSLEETLKASLASQYDTSTWTSSGTTPSLIKKILGMQYIGWLYQKIYSGDNDGSDYGDMLLAEAGKLITSLAAGSITLESITPLGTSAPAFFPTDASSAQVPTDDFPSFGGPTFTLGQIW